MVTSVNNNDYVLRVVLRLMTHGVVLMTQSPGTDGSLGLGSSAHVRDASGCGRK